MVLRRAGRDPRPPDPARARQAGFAAVRANELYAPILRLVRPVDIDTVGVRASALRRGGLLAIDARGGLVYNGRARAEETRWVWALCHVLTHLGLGHADPTRRDGRGSYTAEWRAACCLSVDRFLGVLHLPGLPPVPPGLDGDEAALALRFAAGGVPRALIAGGAAGGGSDLWEDLFERPRSRSGAGASSSAWGRTFAVGLASLEAGIRALEHPDPAWAAQFSAWFGDRFPGPSRPLLALPAGPAVTSAVDHRHSLRPAATGSARTFGVVVDSSASMDRRLLGRALDAIVASAAASDVRRVRLVMCEGRPRDAGWLPPEHLASRVHVGGRAGSAIQPGIDLLGADATFPADGPVLLLTDGRCDRVRIHHDHAWLTTGHLPFPPRGPVFRLA